METVPKTTPAAPTVTAPISSSPNINPEPCRAGGVSPLCKTPQTDVATDSPKSQATPSTDQKQRSEVSSALKLPSPWSWPRLWEYSLAFILGACALLIAQSAWKLIRPPEPLSAALGGVDLNAADIGTLKQLPGVGPHLAARIVDHREKHGPFVSVDDLKAVQGVGPVTLERLRPALFIGANEKNDATAQQPPALQPLMNAQPRGPKSNPNQPVDLNQATKEQLANLPGIGPTLADRILEDRQKNGPFPSINDLTRIRGIKAKTVEKLAPFVIVGSKEKPA